MQGGLMCPAFCPSVCPMSMDQNLRLENNSYLKKYSMSSQQFLIIFDMRYTD